MSLLPTRRHLLTGTDFDGNSVQLEFSISKQLYRCPGCRKSIPIGSEHVFVRITEPGVGSYHQHWHRECSRALARELRDIQRRPAR
jgi:hypothetical protein